MKNYSPRELMVINAAQELKDGDIVLVGIGLPNLSATLAQKLHAPGIRLIYESGIIGSNPTHLPLSIGDPCLLSGALSTVSQLEFFSFYLQRGLIDVGFMGAAEVDRFGNINSTIIGDYKKPKVRLPGSGGACEIAIMAKKVVIMIQHQKRNFPEEISFITSPGFLGGEEDRNKLELMGGGPQTIITDMGIIKFEDTTKEMILVSVHPGVDVDMIKDNTGWDLKIADNLTITKEPEEEQLRILREEVDPQGLYFR